MIGNINHLITLHKTKMDNGKVKDRKYNFIEAKQMNLKISLIDELSAKSFVVGKSTYFLIVFTQRKKRERVSKLSKVLCDFITVILVYLNC